MITPLHRHMHTTPRGNGNSFSFSAINKIHCPWIFSQKYAEWDQVSLHSLSCNRRDWERREKVSLPSCLIVQFEMRSSLPLSLSASVSSVECGACPQIILPFETSNRWCRVNEYLHLPSSTRLNSSILEYQLIDIKRSMSCFYQGARLFQSTLVRQSLHATYSIMGTVCFLKNQCLNSISLTIVL